MYAVLVACAIGTEALIGASTANASVVVLSDNFRLGQGRQELEPGIVFRADLG